MATDEIGITGSALIELTLTGLTTQASGDRCLELHRINTTINSGLTDQSKRRRVACQQVWHKNALATSSFIGGHNGAVGRVPLDACIGEQAKQSGCEGACRRFIGEVCRVEQ